MKKLLILGLALIASPFFLNAHNPLSAKYYLENQKENGLLSIYLSQNGAHAALISQYGAEHVASLKTAPYKELLIKYLKNHFELSINDTVVKLKEGGIKLGNHQTDVKFTSSILPHITKNIVIKINAFKENEHHQTIFDYQLNGKKGSAILSRRNDYQQVLLASPSEGFLPFWVWIVSGLGLIAVVFWFTYKK